LKRIQALVIRISDIVLSAIGLILTAPFLPVLAIVIKLNSRGPVFYQAERVGKDLRRFHMYKFRTMLQSSTKIDQSICPRNDPRVTSVGRFLRRTKLNEFPQLFNVLKGDMSFVGPRPEAPDLVGAYPEEAKALFSVKPGLVGPVVISALKGNVRGRNEEELYPSAGDPIQYYLEHILPEKVNIDLYYLSRLTVLSYFQLIFSALAETIFGALSLHRVDRARRQLLLFVVDSALSPVSFGLSYYACIRLADIHPPLNVFLGSFLLTFLTRTAVQDGSGLYNCLVELTTPRDFPRVVKAVGLGSLLMLIFGEVGRIPLYPPVLAAIDFCVLSSMLVAVRLFLMALFRAGGEKGFDGRPSILIFGANRRGLDALQVLGGSRRRPFRVVGFVDDAEEKYGRTVAGMKVLGNRHHLQALSVLYGVREVILALDRETWGEVDDIADLCARAGIRLRVFSESPEGETLGGLSYPLRRIQLSDVLPRVQVLLEEGKLRSLLSGKTVLVFGSGGELGVSICCHLRTCGCQAVVIVDRFEPHLRAFLAELSLEVPGFNIFPVLLDGRDPEALGRVFSKHDPRVVIHAGMRKFVPLRRCDDAEVAECNYFRTFKLAEVTARSRCEYFLVISSIKAASGGSFLSESLRVAEASLNLFFSRTATRLIVTRLGNIIENRGGVVSWISDQILERGRVRLPAETAKIFLLPRDAAARSILQAVVRSSKIPSSGFLLTSEPGICMEFSDLARKIARFYGIALGADVPVGFGEISNGLLQDEPSMLSDGAGDAILAMRGIPGGSAGSERWYRMIEDMVSQDVSRFSESDRSRLTEEITSLGNSGLFQGKKWLVTN